MPKLFCVLFSIFILCVGQAAAVTVETVLCSGVEALMPVDTVESFAAGIERVYLWNRLLGVEGESFVRHVWLYEGREMADVELPVRSASWRTYSYKTILPEWTGTWEVKIVGADGNVVKSIPFTIGDKGITTEAEPEKTQTDTVKTDTTVTTPPDSTKNE
ncbi:MAG: DUF2914 domain-containing protein [candidate division Zixibacteria bacterium]